MPDRSSRPTRRKTSSPIRSTRGPNYSSARFCAENHSRQGEADSRAGLLAYEQAGLFNPALEPVLKIPESNRKPWIGRDLSPFMAPKAIWGQVAQKDAPMLGFLSGLNTGVGRLHYFLSTIALAVGMTAVWFAIASYAIQNSQKGMDPSANLVG